MLKTIKNEIDYQEYLDRAYNLMQLDLSDNSDLSDELDVLSILIEHYENDIIPIPPPDPIEAIKFRMEQLGMNRSQLSSILGNRSRVSDIFNGKRNLSINMIKKIRKELGISADILIK
jgi:HTH-type transcriptional regulator/antitoxin HigA